MSNKDMTFSDSEYFDPSKNIRIVEMPFGTYYLADKYVIGEVKAGVHIDWSKITQIFEIIVAHYPSDREIGFISNRVNPYSIDPNYWNRLNLEYDIVVAFAIVSYNDLGFHNASLEKLYASRSLKRCESLNQAIEWVLSLDELN